MSSPTQGLLEVATSWPPSRAGRTPSRRAWLLGTSALVVVVHAAKFPAMHSYVQANIGNGPDTTGVPDDVLAAALQLGTAFGLLVGAAVGLLALLLVARLSHRLTTTAQRPVPGWLLGMLTVGLVVPDLVTALTGAVSPVTRVELYLAYLPLAAVATWLAPPPRRLRWRVVDVALLVVLPFV